MNDDPKLTPPPDDSDQKPPAEEKPSNVGPTDQPINADWLARLRQQREAQENPSLEEATAEDTAAESVQKPMPDAVETDTAASPVPPPMPPDLPEAPGDVVSTPPAAPSEDAPRVVGDSADDDPFIAVPVKKPAAQEEAPAVAPPPPPPMMPLDAESDSDFTVAPPPTELESQDVPDGPPDWLAASETAEDGEGEEDHSATTMPEENVPAWLQSALAAKEAAAEAAPPVLELFESPDQAEDKPLPEVSDPAAPEDPEKINQSNHRRRARQRREYRARSRQNGTVTNLVQSLFMVGSAAVILATIFTFWTPASFLSDEAREGLRPAYATLSASSPPTPVPTDAWRRRIGIISGHWGPYPTTGRSDPGAVCPDGLTEAEVNRAVAELVVQQLSGMGYDVDLLDEWDPRLQDYQASALVSIHADTCIDFELPGATGYKVAPPSSRENIRPDDTRLTNCLTLKYGEISGLPLHPSLTRDMTEYHTFNEISPVTPAAIIELGFLFEDRNSLVNEPERLAEGIVAGVICFLENAPPTPLPELTPWPTIEATPTPLETPVIT